MVPANDTISLLYSAYNAHDAAAAAKLYVSEGWLEETATGRRRLGRDALCDGLQRLFAMLPDVTWVERERIRSGNSIVVCYTMTGHLAVDLGPIRGVGQPIVLPGIHVFELAEGGIAGTRDYWDAGAFQRQAREGQAPESRPQVGSGAVA